jgi:Rho-binding antiterminator
VKTVRGPYTPVACDLYSRFELAILHRKPLRLAWQTSHCTKMENIRPLDLRTYRGGEYLIALAANGCHLVLRLDRVRAAVDL